MARLDYKMEPFFFTPPRTKLDKALYKDEPKSPSPTNQTITNTSIPEYARPYVERMLGKSEALTSQNPYQTYGGQRIAGFSPMQQKAFGDVNNMQTAGELGGSSHMAGLSGIGSFGTANQMAGYGNQYQRMATDPNMVSQYMNPYLKNALNPAIDEARRQYGITGAQQQGSATNAGAFGGSREALMASENNRNMNTGINQMLGQGYNTAFNNAQQAQQFGANLGLQGMQGALQGYGQANQSAANLANIGNTRFGQQQTINADQQKVGAVQQAQAQQGLDQQYQDFLKQKNYPYQQLGFMSDMLRGLPLSQASQQIYTAPPNMMSQLGGLGIAGLGIYGASGGFKPSGAAGGEVKSYKAGGDIKLMKDEQLMQIIQNQEASPMDVAAAEEQLMMHRRIRNNPEAEAAMGMEPRSGIGAISTGDMVPEGEPMMAGGGIIAFKSGNKVEDKSSRSDELESRISTLSEQLLKENPFAKSEALAAQTAADAAANKERDPYDILTSLGVNTMAGTSPYALTNLGQGAQGAYKTAKEIQAGEEASRKFAQQQQVEQEKAEFARKSGMLNNMQTTLGQMSNKELGLKQIDATRAATAASRMDAVEQRNLSAAGTTYNALYNQQIKDLYAKEKFLPVKSSDQELAAMAATLAIKQLPAPYRKYYTDLLPKAADPAANPVTSPANPVTSPAKPGPEDLKYIAWAQDPKNAKDKNSILIKEAWGIK